MEYFEKLGTLVEQNWKASHYDAQAFPAIAAQALRELSGIKPAQPQDIIRNYHVDDQTPDQMDTEFSDLAITMYKTTKFYIDAYYWLDGTNTIHQHGFEGAFQVLTGSSLHWEYKYRQEIMANSSFTMGQLALEGAEMLREGDIRTILPGNQFIHTLFHLDRPSVTICLRTSLNQDYLPQYTYLKPHIAIDPLNRDPSVIKKAQSVGLLLRMGRLGADSTIDEMLSGSDLQSSFAILNTLFHYMFVESQKNAGLPVEHLDRYHTLLDITRKKHGAMSDYLPPVFTELRRTDKIVKLRKRIISRDHRYFLALLLNAPNRSLLLDLTKQWSPQQNPIDVVAQWIIDISSIDSSWLPKLSPLEDKRYHSLYAAVLRRLLEGMSIDEVENALMKGQDVDQSLKNNLDIKALCKSLQNSHLLGAILSASGERSYTSHQLAVGGLD